MKDTQGKKHQHVKRRILYKSTVMLYLLFFIVSQATSPTTAYFTDTETIGGNLSNASTFVEKKKQENKQDSKGNQGDLQTDSDNIDRENGDDTDEKYGHKQDENNAEGQDQNRDQSQDQKEDQTQDQSEDQNTDQSQNQNRDQNPDQNHVQSHDQNHDEEKEPGSSSDSEVEDKQRPAESAESNRSYPEHESSSLDEKLDSGEKKGKDRKVRSTKQNFDVNNESKALEITGAPE
ncbi:SipW-dependent-type signal peptide-containing protein [Virgibacillus sp. FSP13]